ncbi:unnamed protein product [Somion occarium]|uniref:Uncharacterized protein n=1 Tax=Somion occarium TaxID=3059160 RepID=A0ABP1DDP6_9APHY
MPESVLSSTLHMAHGVLHHLHRRNEQQCCIWALLTWNLAVKSQVKWGANLRMRMLGLLSAGSNVFAMIWPNGERQLRDWRHHKNAYSRVSSVHKLLALCDYKPKSDASWISRVMPTFGGNSELGAASQEMNGPIDA